VPFTGAGEVELEVSLRVAVDLAVAGHREGRYRRAFAVLDEQAGGTDVGDRQPDLPLVELFHGVVSWPLLTLSTS
jgi:hypothetical protein